MKRLKIAAAAMTAVAVATLSACASGNSESGASGGSGNGKQITIGYINWDEDVAVTHLWEKILKDKGYNVTAQSVADAGPTYVGLNKGNLDLFFDGWLPATHAAYWKKYKKNLVDVKTWYDSAPLAIAVPNYVKDVKSIADLKKHAKEFDKTIVGIEPGAGETAVVKKMMPKYGLSGWTQKSSSTAGMLATLKKDIAAKKPVAVTLWHPHWAYQAYPIRDLKDPKGAMGKPDQIHAIGDKTFPKDFPDVNKMVKKFHMTDQQLSSLEQQVLVKHKDNPKDGVDAWLKANPKFESSLSS